MKKYCIEKDQRKDIKLTEPGEYLVELVGEGAQANIFGAFVVTGEEHFQIKITIHHRAKHTHAETVLKAVGKDQSYTQLYGKIIIDENCGDSQSFLQERILLLSPNAKAEAVPDLEIKTDDVKCSHAASVSNISKDQVFYLTSRGLSKTQAENLIIEGFLTA